MTVLQRGFTVNGRVLDSQGKPIAGARVRVGEYSGNEPPPATTDDRGAFRLENCRPGASIVIVQAPGFAPDLRPIHPEDRPDVEFRLEPGHTLRGRVVDRQGKPIAGAFVAAETWRSHRSLDFRVESNAEGHFEWRNAPSDAVRYSIGKAGAMYRRDVELRASETEHVVTLDPELVISGRVTDAATGKDVPSFRVVRGIGFANNPRMTWMVQEASQFTGGRYTIRQTEPYSGHGVRIEADGYKPTDSRVFKSDEGAVTFDFALERAAAVDLLIGVVVRTDGKPAAGVEVALATPDHPLVFEMTRIKFSRSNGMSFAKTGPEGRFTFDKPAGPYLLAALSDDGYAQVDPESFEKSPRLELSAWGKIVGDARIGNQPATDQPITILRRNSQPGRRDAVHVFDHIETKTDAQGRFTFDRVIPGSLEVARVIVTKFASGGQQHMGCWQEPVDVKPGQTVTVRLGGTGRAVVGRIVFPPGKEVPHDWRQNAPAVIEKRRGGFVIPSFLGPDPREFTRYASNIDKDGRFRIDDVPPGDYQLTVPINEPAGGVQVGPGQEIGRVTRTIEIPAGVSAKPIDLGDIPADVNTR